MINRAIRAPEGVLMFAGEDMARDGVQPMRCGWVLPGMVERGFGFSKSFPRLRRRWGWSSTRARR